MSYPSAIQPLVIEDESGVKVIYETILNRLGTAPPKFAFCYEDAVEQLKSSTVFHLVLLDLRLPRSAGLPSPEGIDLGLALLDECIGREWYPIPALMIVSGHVARANQSDLREKVRDNFSYGHVLVKGSDPELLEAEIENAIKAIECYVGIGVHLRDAERRATYPVISPREEDLLRRAVLGYQGGIGLDLEWWTANRYSNPQEPDSEWTKVLMGRFMLSGGDRPSRPHFFKLYKADDRARTVTAARGLASKLQHVSVIADTSGLTRSLLVTQAVGPSDRRPVSLRQWLSDPSQSTVAVRLVAAQIVQQLDQVGGTSANVQPLHRFLWDFHDDELIRREWLKWGSSALGGTDRDDPLAVLNQLREQTAEMRYMEQSFVHGDLHAENVAIDVGDAVDGPRAFVFDAGATSRCPRLKDLAILEVSALLHTDGGLQVGTLAGLNDSSLPETSPKLTFVRALRAGCLPAVDDWQWPIYALLVFDHALVQLGCLAFGVSGNKVRNPEDAAVLAAHCAAWVKRLFASAS